MSQVFEQNQKSVGFTVTKASDVNKITQSRGKDNRLRHTAFYQKVVSMLKNLHNDPELRIIGGLTDRELADLPLRDPMQALKVTLERDFGKDLEIGSVVSTYKDESGKRKREIKHIWVA